MNQAKKFLPPLFFALILGLVIWQVEPPENFSAATTTQFLFFFIPIFLLITSLINLYTKFLPKSFILGLGLVLILVLRALDFFIFLTIPTIFLITLFAAKKMKKSAKRSLSPKTLPPIKPRWLKLPEIKPEAIAKRPKLSRIKNI